MAFNLILLIPVNLFHDSLRPDARRTDRNRTKVAVGITGQTGALMRMITFSKIGEFVIHQKLVTNSRQVGPIGILKN